MIEKLTAYIPQSIMDFYSEQPVKAILYTIGALIILKITIKILLGLTRLIYYYYQSRNLVYMQVIQPRADSQKDKEDALEKDFKERVAIMEQLYRSLHEISELNLWNHLKVILLQHDLVSFEMVVHNKVLDFYVICPKYYAELVEKQITAFYKDADVEIVKPYKIIDKGLKSKMYCMYQTRPYYFPVRVYKDLENDPLNDMTNVLSKLEEEEIGAIQMVMRPRTSTKWQKEADKIGTAMFKNKKVSKFHIPGLGILNSIFIGILFGYDKVQKDPSKAGGGDPMIRMLQTKEEDAKSVGEKAQRSGFDTVIRIVSSAKTDSRAELIANNIVLSFNIFKQQNRNYFQNRRIIPIDFINNKIMHFNFRHRFLNLFEKGSLLSTDELASVYHFPTSRYNYTPVIRWLLYKTLPAPTNMPEEGILLGHNVYRGVKKEIRFKRKDRSRHHYIIGKSGSGKSALLSYMARQDAQKDGLCVIDPHGDLIEDILGFIPKERAKDVIVFDPADVDRPMGLNILEAKTPEQQDMASSQATEIFIKLFGDEIFGPRIQHYFRNACLTLMEDQEEGATLIDVPRMFTDDEFMKYKVTKVKNPVVRSFWEHEYAHTGDREKQEMIPYFSSKFGPFITNSIMRNTIGQTKSAFNFRECMDQQKILLVNLSKGKIGDLNTQLLGLILVASVQMAAMSRVDMPEDQRKDFYLYVDEFQNFATDSFCSILSEARKYHLCLIMAHQYINQLVVSKSGASNTQIRDAVFGNCGTIMSFKVGADDAEYLQKEYAPVLSPQDIIGIANYKAYIKLLIDNATSRPFSIQTIWDTSTESAKIREILKEYSRMKYGRKKIFVDQEIAARIGIDLHPDEPAEANTDTQAPEPLPPQEAVGLQTQVPPIIPQNTATNIQTPPPAKADDPAVQAFK